MLSGGFRRSSLFGLFGVIVVAAIVVVIAFTTGEGQGNPKLTYALIFGVLAVFMVVLFALQRSDMERVATGSARGTERAVTEGGREIENPTMMEEPALWAALAVKPIDREAIRARSQMWDTIRGVIAAGATVLLTTQYLEEADELASQIAVIDHGLVVAAGTPAELKARTGSQNFSSKTPLPQPSRRGNGGGSVPHLIAATCWIISATASVDST